MQENWVPYLFWKAETAKTFLLEKKKSIEVCKTRKAMSTSHTQQHGLLPNYQEDVKCRRRWKRIKSEEFVMGSSWRHIHCLACLLRKAPVLLSSLHFLCAQHSKLHQHMLECLLCATQASLLSAASEKEARSVRIKCQRACFSPPTSYKTLRVNKSEPLWASVSLSVV